MKTQHHHYHVGIDISKQVLDIFCPFWTKTRSFPNTKAGVSRCLKLLKGKPHLVCEATGGYEKTLVSIAHIHDIPLSVVNPRQVRDFARASGCLAKTDSIDASMIAGYADCFKPTPDAVPSPEHCALREAVRRRDSIVRLRSKEKGRLDRELDAFVRKDIKTLIGVLDRRIAKFDKHIDKLVLADPVMVAKKERMEEVKSIGRVVSTTLLSELPELGSMSEKQASSLSGLAPFNRDSGTMRGKRVIVGGRGLVRRTLYMPALCATRHNPILRDFYAGLIARGKPHHVAITAVMRKLVCLLNRMLREPNFTPQ